MADDYYIGYLIACILMGLGIGADVAIATLGRALVITQKTARVWVLRITVTHVVFPMIGYYVFVFLSRAMPAITLALGLIASYILAKFLYELVKDWLNTTGLSPMVSSEWYSWAFVLAVSYDALYSGPAKSAQAVYWSNTEVVLSFFLSGATVWLVAIAATRVSLDWRRRIDQFEWKRAARTKLQLMFLEFSILFYFLILCISRLVFQVPYETLWIIGISLLGSTLIWCALHPKIAPIVAEQMLRLSSTPAQPEQS